MKTLNTFCNAFWIHIRLKQGILYIPTAFQFCFRTWHKESSRESEREHNDQNLVIISPLCWCSLGGNAMQTYSRIPQFLTFLLPPSSGCHGNNPEEFDMKFQSRENPKFRMKYSWETEISMEIIADYDILEIYCM